MAPTGPKGCGRKRSGESGWVVEDGTGADYAMRGVRCAECVAGVWVYAEFRRALVLRRLRAHLMYKRAYPCRCRRRACQHRISLAMRPEHYVREPWCKRCNKGRLRVDEFRLRREHQRYNCDCDGYAYRHRRKSKWCHHAIHEITAQDVAKRYGSNGECPF